MKSSSDLSFKRTLFHSIEAFSGVPNSRDFIAYNELYYDSVQTITLQRFGSQATISDAVKTMNLHGNLVYFRWFCDLYEVDKTILKNFFNPIFTPVGGNLFADYLHGLTHIRSLSSHTNLGEALAVIDNVLNNVVRYQVFMNQYKDVPLSQIEIRPIDLGHDLGRDKLLDNKRFKLFDMIKETWSYQNPEMVFYERTYKSGVFKKEFPAERPSVEFIVAPRNTFERKMQTNFVRAIFLDEKFKLYSKNKLYFSETPIDQSAAEPFNLIFTTELENSFIESLVSNLSLKEQLININLDGFKLLNQALIMNTLSKLNNWISEVYQ